VVIIQLLLDKKTSVILINTDYSILFFVSAQFSHLKATKILVEEVAAIYNTNKYDFTPLMLGAYSGKLEISHYLTEIGAGINIPISNCVTVLIWLFLFVTLKTALFCTSFHPRKLRTISIQSYTN